MAYAHTHPPNGTVMKTMKMEKLPTEVKSKLQYSLDGCTATFPPMAHASHTAAPPAAHVKAYRLYKVPGWTELRGVKTFRYLSNAISEKMFVEAVLCNV